MLFIGGVMAFCAMTGSIAEASNDHRLNNGNFSSNLWLTLPSLKKLQTPLTNHSKALRKTEFSELFVFASFRIVTKNWG